MGINHIKYIRNIATSDSIVRGWLVSKSGIETELKPIMPRESIECPIFGGIYGDLILQVLNVENNFIRDSNKSYVIIPPLDPPDNSKFKLEIEYGSQGTRKNCWKILVREKNENIRDKNHVAENTEDEEKKEITINIDIGPR